MKKSVIAVALVCTALLSSCFGTTGTTTGTTSSVPRPAAATNSTTAATTATTSTAATTTSSSNATSALGSILGTVASGNSNNLLGTILGAFGATTNMNTIVGTWTYQEPSIQFESSNLLAQAGGVVASQTVVNKIKPYYEKLGLKAGVAKITFTSSNTCAITLSGRTINGTYSYNSSAGTVTVTGQTGIKLFTAYISVSLSQLSLTLDTSNLLSFFTNLTSGSNNSTLSTISSLASSFNGMKTGFLFTK